MPNTPPNQFKVALLADVGAKEPFVARIILGLTEILDGTLYLRRDQIKHAIADGLGNDTLTPAFLSLRELRKIARKPEIPLLTKIKPFNDMCRDLWTAYKDRMQTVVKLMGYEIGFLFQPDLAFQKGCENFQRENPSIDPQLIRLMKLNRATWQPELMRFRNDYLEHKKIDGADVAAFYSLEKAESLFTNVWVAIEEILAILLAAKLPVGFTLRDIPENERNPSLPKRFGFASEGQ